MQLTDSIKEGLERFKVGGDTALMMNWSKTGVGFILTQRHCNCSTINPTCYKDGWKVCVLGSCFTNQAESKYAPVEEELLAVTYGLSKIKYYTLGSKKLIVCIDHKPLLGIINDCPLEKINNRRLARLKEKTFGWRFKTIHIKGSKLGDPCFIQDPKQ